VEWRANHFGLWFKMRVGITGFTPPTWFQDSVVRGPFHSFTHDHSFVPQDLGTLMTDRILFVSSFPIMDRFLLLGHLKRFVQDRNNQLKAVLESNQWRRYLKTRNG
jgi:ligand-binding SRPBCC domain-containing protein